MSDNPFTFDHSDDESQFTQPYAHQTHNTSNSIPDTPEEEFDPVLNSRNTFESQQNMHYQQGSSYDSYLDSNQYENSMATGEAEHEVYQSYLDASENSFEDAFNTTTNSNANRLNPFDSQAMELTNISPEPSHTIHDNSQDLMYYQNANQSNFSYTSPQRQVLDVPNYEYNYKSPGSSNIFLTSDTQNDFNDEHSTGIMTHGFERDEDEPEVNTIELVDEDDIANDHSNAVAAGDIKVKLLDDKYYSFDYPVPKSLVDRLPFEKAKSMTEFTHLRYHAITADPKNYIANDYSGANDYINHYPFRQTLYKNPRSTELLIVCTMYNEDEVLLARTLKGVFKNIKHMMKKSEGQWGENTWKNVVVLIVSDGRTKINPRSKSLLTLLGVFQEDIMQEKVNDDQVNAHLFEYTTSLNIGKFKKAENGDTIVPIGADSNSVPVQLMFLLKEQNMQKINSHRWALNFIAPNLNPEVVVLLDVGTEPGPTSIYKLWEAFKDPSVGGACGEIRAMLGNHASMNDDGSFGKKLGRKIGFIFWDFWSCLINPLVAAQNFEYKISNILDKPMESAFGFVTVLPGAFSAYRYRALQGDPLKAYFHGEDMKTNYDKPAGILESNMYLAEDRILCFELVAKKNESYLLRYIHDSYAVTDVPSQIPEFINQRRRWLNGSFFAAVYSVLHFYRLLTSSHNLGRKIGLVIEICYQTISILMSWFNLSIYFLVFRILTLDIVGTFVGEHVGNILAVIFLWIYIAALGLSFILSFGNKPSEAKWLYTLAFGLFSSIIIYMTFCVIALTIKSVNSLETDLASATALQYFKNEKFRNLTISLASTYALYILGSLIFFDLFHIFACTIQYLLLSPAYINVLSVFAFCNIHDISWGTKGALTVTTPAKAATKTTDENGDQQLLLSEKLVDPETMYKQASLDLQKPEPPKENDKQQNMKQSEKNYALGRTYTVLLWLATNFILLVVVLRTGGLEEYTEYKEETNSGNSYWANSNVANTFMTVILWTVAGLALFRFIGCVWYRVSFFFNRRKHSNDVPV